MNSNVNRLECVIRVQYEKEMGFNKMNEKRRAEQRILPNRMPDWHMTNVNMSARVGSPRLDDTANGRKNGITSSLAIAWSSLGAPVKLCRPAPIVDNNEPIKMTHSFGHAILATINLPPIDAPNLLEWMKTEQNETKRKHNQFPLYIYWSEIETKWHTRK